MQFLDFTLASGDDTSNRKLQLFQNKNHFLKVRYTCTLYSGKYLCKKKYLIFLYPKGVEVLSILSPYHEHAEYLQIGVALTFLARSA